MADVDVDVGIVQLEKIMFKKLSYRGVDLDALLEMTSWGKVFVEFVFRSRAEVFSVDLVVAMADPNVDVSTMQPKKRMFKKFSYRGVDVDALLDMTSEEIVNLFHARVEECFSEVWIGNQCP